MVLGENMLTTNDAGKMLLVDFAVYWGIPRVAVPFLDNSNISRGKLHE